MPKKTPELSKAQIGQIRANIGRKATQIGHRLTAYALDKDGSVKMTATQVSAGKVVLSHVLPAQGIQEINDVTESNIGELKQDYSEVRQRILKSATKEEYEEAQARREH